MPIAFQATKRAFVLRDDKFYECSVFEVGDEIRVELTDEGVLISFGEVGLRKSFINIPTEMDEISYVLVDPSQEREKQIVGIAETHWFDESRAGAVHYLQ